MRIFLSFCWTGMITPRIFVVLVMNTWWSIPNLAQVAWLSTSLFVQFDGSVVIDVSCIPAEAARWCLDAL